MAQYNNFVPIGKLTITAGKPVLLSTNCGPYSGQVSTSYLNPAVPGNAWRYMEIQSDASSSGNIYLLPRGSTAAGNPGNIMAKIGIGGSGVFPSSLMQSTGFVPENYVLDADSSVGSNGVSIAYGFGCLG